MGSKPLLVRDPRFREHISPQGHPERPERLDAVDQALETLGDRVLELAPRPADDAEILRVHDSEALTALRRLEGRAGQLDPDTYTSARSLEIARLAAGSTVELGLRMARGEAARGFALIRPPGHHAERERAMGFCLLNNVAVAAAALRAECGVERLAIVDWDVHHGNGTQHLFEAERDVLFISLHQFPFYPGTGALHEQGRDAGRGTTLNLPLPAGCGDAEYGACFDQIVVPVLHEFRPQMLLVSAGFDAHLRDPLASMRVSTAGFAAFAARLREISEAHCNGRLLLALEGGYDLEALGASVAAVIDVLCEASCPRPSFPKASEVGSTLTARFREAHAKYWKSLARVSSSHS